MASPQAVETKAIAASHPRQQVLLGGQEGFHHAIGLGEDLVRQGNSYQIGDIVIMG